VIEFCRVLNQYYVKYITLFVAEYGLGSAYKNGYPDENAYIIALCMLIEMQKPLLDAEKRGGWVLSLIITTARALFN
jgi:hypothetical protein